MRPLAYKHDRTEQSGLDAGVAAGAVAHPRLVIRSGIAEGVHDTEDGDHRDADGNDQMDAQFGDLEDVGVRALNFSGNEDAGFVSFADYFRHDQPCSISIRAPEYS